MKKKLQSILTLTVLFLFAGANIITTAKEKPNVIIILSDDQGWGDVGFNGCTDIPTPNLDRLAEEGVSFQQGYASHPYCSPSRAGLLTGRYQQRFGHENNLPYTDATADDGLPLNEVLISEVLQKNGYQTCAIGKWHLGDSAKFWPNKVGFDDWFGFFGGGMSFWGDPKKGADPYHGVLRDGIPVPLDEISYLTDDFSDAAIDYIDEYSNKEQPFFMYLAYNAPHAPNHATQKYLDRMKHVEDGERAVYGAMVYGMDEGIGRVIAKLKEKGEYENTLIFFYSDNGGRTGGAVNHPFRGHKGMLFEGGIRVPFLVSWPTTIEGGKRYHKPISALDIFPTILAATGAKHPKPQSLDGVDMLPYLQGNKKNATPHNIIFWRYSDGAGYAVRKGDYKMIWSGYKKRFLLFNIEEDPYEMNNVVEQYPEKLAELRKEYKEWTKGTVMAKWQDPHAANVSKEEAKRQALINAAKRGEKQKK